jgi:hypothetical protein
MVLGTSPPLTTPVGGKSADMITRCFRQGGGSCAMAGPMRTATRAPVRQMAMNRENGPAIAPVEMGFWEREESFIIGFGVSGPQ